MWFIVPQEHKKPTYAMLGMQKRWRRRISQFSRLWNALLRLVWFKFCLQMVVLFDKVGIFQTMTSLEELDCWEQTLEFIATYNADTKALLLICQAVRNFCCKLKAAFTESHLPSFHTMMDCFPKIGN